MLDSHMGTRGQHYQPVLGITIAIVTNSLQKKLVTNWQVFNGLYIIIHSPKWSKKANANLTATYLSCIILKNIIKYLYTHICIYTHLQTQRELQHHVLFAYFMRKKLMKEVLLVWMKPSHKQLIRNSCFLTCQSQRQVSLLL